LRRLSFLALVFLEFRVPRQQSAFVPGAPGGRRRGDWLAKNAARSGESRPANPKKQPRLSDSRETGNLHNQIEIWATLTAGGEVDEWFFWEF